MFAPVARLQDFHLCPMQTPAVVPIPHVGGPVVGPGAATVLAGGMPVTVLGDMAICVGPPDVFPMGSPTVHAMGRPVVRITDTTAHGGMVVAGFPTVMVGDSGGAGSAQAATMSAAKAGGSAFVRAECDAKAATAAVTAAKPPAPTGTSWIEAEFVDDTGKPVPFQRVEVRDAGGTPRIGFSDADGLVRLDGLAIGPATMTLPDLDGSSWAPLPPGSPRTVPGKRSGGGGTPGTDPPAAEPMRLRVALETLGGKPVKGATCTVRLGQAGTRAVTDGSGLIELTLPAGVDRGEVVLDGLGTTLHRVTIPFTVGTLPPVDTILGQEARLNNLGYRAGTSADPSSLAFRSAVEEFQCDEKLVVDGKCGPKTQAKLKSVHGS